MSSDASAVSQSPSRNEHEVLAGLKSSEDVYKVVDESYGTSVKRAAGVMRLSLP